VNSETLLLRQIHPNFVQDGRPADLAFRPSKDDNMLSVYNGAMIAAAASWHHYTVTLNLKSVGVMALSCAELASEKLNVIEDRDPFPEHCSVDFSGLRGSEVKMKSKKLAAYAKNRDWLFQP